MEMLRRPVVDALYLTPLAFAENPCHRLVKNYKLVRNAVSDPITDAFLAAAAFREQRVEFARRWRARHEAARCCLQKYFARNF
jgi:ATP-dependent DNA helicase RecQ